MIFKSNILYTLHSAVCKATWDLRLLETFGSLLTFLWVGICTTCLHLSCFKGSEESMFSSIIAAHLAKLVSCLRAWADWNPPSAARARFTWGIIAAARDATIHIYCLNILEIYIDKLLQVCPPLNNRLLLKSFRGYHSWKAGLDQCLLQCHWASWQLDNYIMSTRSCTWSAQKQ